MPRPWLRIAGCAAAALLALVLCGCEVQGTVDVKSGTVAVADLVFTESEADCLGLTRYAGLVIKGIPDSGGHQTCRAQGTIDLASLKDIGIQLNQTGEYLIVDLALPEQVGYLPLKVDLRFPGAVRVDGGMPVTGDSVRLGNATIAGSGPIRIVALSHPGPEWWIISLVGGLVGGVVLTLAGLLVLRRWRRLRTREQADAEAYAVPDAAPAEEAHTPVPAARPDAASTLDSARAPDHEALFAPPPPGTVVAPVRAPEPSPPSQPAAAAADHTIWAPPGDRGDR